MDQVPSRPARSEADPGRSRLFGVSLAPGNALRLSALLVMVCLVMAGTGVVAPVLSVYAATFSASATLVGLMITLFGVGRLLADLPAGLGVRRFGPRPLLVAGPLVILAGCIGAALAETFAWLLAWRFLQGVGGGLYLTASGAALALISRSGERGRLMALYQSAIFLGAGIGPAIGGVLAARFGFAAPFWAYGAVAGLAALVAWLGFREPGLAAAEAEEEASAATGLIGRPAFLGACLVNAGQAFTRTAGHWLAVPLLAHERLGFASDAVGLALSAAAVANFAMLPPAGRLVDRVGGAPVVLAGSLVTGVALGAIGLAEGPGLFWAGVVLLGLGGGLVGPAVSAFAIDQVPRSRFGEAVGAQRAFADAGFLAGPALVGALGDLAGLTTAGAVWLNAGVVLGTAAVFLALLPRRPHAR